MRIFALLIDNSWYEFWVKPDACPTWCNDYDDWDLCCAVEQATRDFGKTIVIEDWREVEYNPEMEM